MKKAVAMAVMVMMVLALSVSAFAAGQLTVEDAKQAALNYAGVRASEATVTKAYQDWDDGRMVYEIEVYANGTEYDMDVDVNSGRITDFSKEHHGGYSQPFYGGYNQPANGGYYGYDYDWDDRYEYDYDWDDRYDDDWFDWD